MKYLIFTTCLILFTLTTTVSAETVVRTGDRVVVDSEQSISGNFYTIGNSVTIAGDSDEDVTIIGGRLQVTGSVLQDVLGLGVAVAIDGPVSGDVRIVGGDVRVAGTISGDLVVVGAMVELQPDAVVGGDVLVYGGAVNVDGDVSGDVLGKMEKLSVNGVVGGNVDVATVNLALGDSARIDGNVLYTSNNLLSQAFNTTIGGDIVRKDPIYLGNPQHLQSVALFFLILLLASFVWFFLSRNTLSRVTGQTLKQLPRSAITGVISLFILPLVMVVLAFSYLGSLVAVVLLFGYITLLLLALVALPAVVGQLAMKLFNQPHAKLSPLAVLVGAVCCGIFVLFPVIGPFILFFAMIVVFGGLIELLIGASR